MGTKIYRTCDNCKHEQKVEDTEAKPKGWWEGEFPVALKSDGDRHYGLICDGCVEGLQSALLLRRKGTRHEVGEASPS